MQSVLITSRKKIVKNLIVLSVEYYSAKAQRVNACVTSVLTFIEISMYLNTMALINIWHRLDYLWAEDIVDVALANS